MLNSHLRFNLRAIVRPILFLSTALLPVACDDGKDLIAPAPTVTGTVTSSVTGHPVAGALVQIQSSSARTDADGRFELSNLTTGAATLRGTAIGFEDFETDISVTSGSATRDIELTQIEVFEFGDFALYVPGSVASVRGVIIALGGPDTRGFATGKPMGAPIPAVEASLQTLGLELRALAAEQGLALLGTSQVGMPNGAESDQLLRNALQTAAAMSGRPGLPTAPVLMYGMSGGGPEGAGFTVRNTDRVAGLFLKAPLAVTSVTGLDAARVPTYMVLAELDAFVNNAELTAAFESNRAGSALWALAKELGVVHHSLSPVQRQVTLTWMSTILGLRLPSVLSAPLRAVDESSGWLGNIGNGAVAPWASYPGDKKLASWLPSQAIALEWQTIVAAAGATAGR